MTENCNGIHFDVYRLKKSKIMKTLKKCRDPFDTFFLDLGTEFGKIMDQFPLEYPLYKSTKTGQVNLSVGENDYSVEVSAPGFTKEELSVELKDHILTIKGEHVEDKKNYSMKEFSKNSFSRSFTVPKDITGEVIAKFENGLLYLSLGKKELPPKEEPKKIEIK